MKIIGHRGAAGMALENTEESIRSALKAGVDAVEVDVRLTKDERLVLSHDLTTARVSKTDRDVAQTTLKGLQRVALLDGSHLLSLEQALRIVGKTPLIIDAKGSGWASALARELPKSSSVSVVAFNHNELSVFASLRPEIPTYALERWSIIDIVQTARHKNFTGVDLNFWILNPLTYWLARRAGLKVIVYTVNRLWIAKFLNLLYPNISITTDYPNNLQSLRKHRR